MKFKYNWQETEKDWLEWLVGECDHNITKAAKLSGLSAQGVKAKIVRHKLLDWHEQHLLEQRKKKRARLYAEGSI